MLYISHTGCQWRFLPEEFGPWTRIWSQFRRWSRNGTWTRVLVALHASSRIALGRKYPRPSMVVIDTHLARGASNGGATFHNQGGPYGRTNGAERIVCVDVTGMPLCVRVVPASTSEASAVEQILDDLVRAAKTRARGPRHGAVCRHKDVDKVQLRGPTSRLGRTTAQRARRQSLRPIRHAWRVEVAHGHLVRRRRLARCFENTVTSATGWLHIASISELLRALC
jgi:putative transposase